MRIEVLEDYLRQDNNILVLDKLVKAYGKAGRLEELKERLADWIEKNILIIPLLKHFGKTLRY